MNHSSLKSSSGAHKQEAEDLTTGVQHLSKQTKFYLKSWGSNKMLNSVKIYYLHSLLVFFYWLLWWSHTENTRKWINAMSVKKKMLEKLLLESRFAESFEEVISTEALLCFSSCVTAPSGALWRFNVRSSNHVKTQEVKVFKLLKSDWCLQCFKNSLLFRIHTKIH